MALARAEITRGTPNGARAKTLPATLRKLRRVMGVWVMVCKSKEIRNEK
jgi:hypothetical protein